MPVDLKNKPDEDSRVDPPWIRRESDPLEEAYSAPAATDDDLPKGHPSRSDSSGLSGKGLAAAEEGIGSGSASTGADTAENNQVGGFYKGKGGRNGGIKQNLGKFLGSKKGKLMAGGLGGGLVGIIMLIMSVLPLKVMHMVDNLQMRFFAGTEQAAEDMGEHLLRSYIVEKVMPGMVGNSSCTSTLTNRNCVSRSPGDTPIDFLYNSWRDAKLEKKLAEKGIVIEKRGQGGRNFVLITPSTLREGGIDLGEFDPDQPDLMNSSLARRMNEGQARREVRDAFSDETFMMRMVYKYKFGRFVERKWGVTRCLGACNAKFVQTLNEKVADKKLAWKLAFIDRIVVPRNELYGTAMACALDGFRCSETPGEADENGMRESEFEESARSSLKNRNSGSRSVNDPELKSLLEEFNTKGIGNAVLEAVVGKIAAKGATTGVPIAGQVIASVEVFNALRAAGPAAKHINYVVNSQAMATTYMMYRSHADEYRAGRVDSTIAASVGASLGSNNGTDQNGGPAESSPFYSESIGGKESAATIPNPLTAKASAAGAYPCNTDDETITSGVCSELNLAHSNGFVDAAGGLSAFLDSPLFIQAQLSSAILTPLIEIADSAIGWVVDQLPVEQLPGYDTLVEYSAKFTQAFAKWFATRFINDAVGESPSGGRMVDLAAGGADVTANIFNQHVFGAGTMSDSAATQIWEERELERRKEFEQRPLMARIFDTSNSYSLVSKAAMALPSDGLGNVPQLSFGSFINPFGTAASTVRQSFAGATSTASAATPGNLNVFGVTQRGYAKNDPVFTTSPKKYWETNNCSDPDNKKKWGEEGEINPDTGIAENKHSNGCMLLESIATSSCAYANDECLTPEELGPSDPTDPNVIGGNGNLRIASLNVLGHCHTERGCGSFNKPGYDSGPERMRKQLQLWDKHKIDVVGVQEFEPPQRSTLVSAGAPEWGIFPTTAEYNEQFAKQSIIYRKGKYEFRQGGGYLIPYGGGQLKVAWAILQVRGSDFKFRVINTHDAADARGNAAQRLEATRRHIEHLQEFKQEEGIPIYFVGDFNANTNENPNQEYPDNDRNKSAYCMLTSTGYYRHAYDALHNSREAPCPTRKALGIDHIFVPKEAQITLFKQVGAEHTSDHPLVFADIAVEDGSSGEEWQWPVLRADYVPLSNCFENPGHTGIDVPIQYKRVLAAADGVVVETGGPSGDGGNYIIIKHSNGKWTNYQHLSNKKVSRSDTVKQGDVIGISGNTGFSTGPHLHFSITTQAGLDSRNEVAYSVNPLTLLPRDGRSLGSCQ